MSEQPAYGTERIVLVNAHPRRRDAKFVIRREVFVEGPPANFYDESAKDFVTWRGSWTVVETLGKFNSKAEVTEFMRAQGGAS